MINAFVKRAAALSGASTRCCGARAPARVRARAALRLGGVRTALFTVILFGSGILAYVLLLLGATVAKPHIFATVVCVLIYALVALMILGSAGADCRSALTGPRWSNARRLRWAVVWICAVYVAIAFQETLVDLLKRSHLDVTEGQLAFVLFYWPLAKISLDFVGYSLALGFLAFAALYCFGFCWCACCCGRSGMRRRAKRKADGQEPFIDLIENRSISWLANTLMFVITFALPSYVALAGTAMVGPDRVLPLVPGAPSRSPLCKGAALAALQRPAKPRSATRRSRGSRCTRGGVRPRSIHELCFANGDAGLAPLTVAPIGADVRAAEALWLAVRDANNSPFRTRRSSRRSPTSPGRVGRTQRRRRCSTTRARRRRTSAPSPAPTGW